MYGEGLKFQPLPQFGLTGEAERHRALRVHLEVQQEPDFFKHISVEQMGLINDNNWQEAVDALHILNFL